MEFVLHEVDSKIMNDDISVGRDLHHQGEDDDDNKEEDE